jgi:hypothetical protein
MNNEIAVFQNLNAENKKVKQKFCIFFHELLNVLVMLI